MHAKVLPCVPRAISLPTLVLIAKAVFLLEHGQTNRQTDRQTDRRDWMTYPTPAAIQPTWVININKTHYHRHGQRCLIIIQCVNVGNHCTPFLMCITTSDKIQHGRNRHLQYSLKTSISGWFRISVKIMHRSYNGHSELPAAIFGKQKSLCQQYI